MEEDEKKGEREYKGWLNSTNFLKRAIAVVGYNFLGMLVISVAVTFIAILFMIAGFFAGSFTVFA